MSLKTEDNPLPSVPAVEQADSEQVEFVKGEGATDEQTARGLAKKHGVDFIKLSEVNLSPHIVRLLPQWLVTQHNVVAVKFEGDTLYVAIVNPLDLPTLDKINLVTGFNVKPMVATEREILQAISRHYGAEQMTKQDLVDARFDQEQIEQRDEHVEDLALSSEAGQVVKLINFVIRDGIDSVASDIHFEPAGNRMFVRLRVDGILHDVMTIPAAMRNEVISRIKILSKLDITEKRKAQDGHINLKYKENDYDLRVSVVPTVDGEKTVIRILDKNTVLTSLDSLGISSEERGLI